MRWKGRKRSQNVEDRRRGGPVTRKRAVGGGVGVVGIGIALLIYFMGGDPSVVLNAGSGGGLSQAPRTSAPSRTPSKKEDELAEFVSVVLQDTEDAWNSIFNQQVEGRYREPVLVLYSGTTNTACGYGDAASGPFYCPGDQKLYIDLSFSNELKNNYGAAGDFALAYVVAHEVGHHVQNLLGTLSQVQSEKRRLSKTDANRLQVMVELQADFYAGVWAYHAQKMKGILDKGDIEEALGAASSVGDDRLQKRSRGYVVPESFTHGTSAQRMRWFKKGFNSGRMSDGDTFSASRL